VDAHLLGSVYRPGIGHQVTYHGHPLYVFDGVPPFLFPPSAPAGEGYLETVAPMPPWHGLWDLVATKGGEPASGQAIIETETLPDGRKAVAAEESPTYLGYAITAYVFSGDRARHSTCTGLCAMRWIPVRTVGKPVILGGIPAGDVGTLRRSDGTEQVSYEGKPLYLYSAEKFVFPRPGWLLGTGTDGNGNGVAAPQGGVFSIVYPG
jgi:predicted lipoprotein with Yx(FWY)xxD motif